MPLSKPYPSKAEEAITKQEALLAAAWRRYEDTGDTAEVHDHGDELFRARCQRVAREKGLDHDELFAEAWSRLERRLRQWKRTPSNSERHSLGRFGRFVRYSILEARRHLLSMHRREWTNVSGVEQYAVVRAGASKEPYEAADTDAQELLVQLRLCQSTLDTQAAKLVQLLFFEEEQATHAEIAKRFGRNTKTIGKWRHAAVDSLRKCLRRHGFDL